MAEIGESPKTGQENDEKAVDDMKRNIDWNYLAGLAFCAFVLACVTVAWCVGKMSDEKALVFFGIFGARTVYMLRGFRAPALPGSGEGASGGAAGDKPSTPAQTAMRVALGAVLFGLLGVHHGREA